MKKILLGSTALAFAAFAGQAQAQQVNTKAPFEITLDGFSSTLLGAVSGASIPGAANSVPSATSANVAQRSYSLSTDNRLIFDAHATADNGLKYGIFWRVYLDTNLGGERNATYGSDRANVYFSGFWGRLEAGNNKEAPYKLNHEFIVTAPYAAVGGDTVGLNGLEGGNVQTFRFLPGGAGTNSIANPAITGGVAGALNYASNFGDTSLTFSNATMITYLTPKIEGFQAGVSFVPDTTNRSGQQSVRNEVSGASAIALPALTNTQSATSLSTNGGYEAAWLFGATYQQQLTNLGIDLPGVGVLADFSYTYAAAKKQTFVLGGVTRTNANYNDVNSFQGGAGVSYAGFQFGGGITWDGTSRLPRSSAVTGAGAAAYTAANYRTSNAIGYAVGLSYELGPWGAGAYWQQVYWTGSPSRYALGYGTDRAEIIEIGSSYKVAPGFKYLIADAFHYDLKDNGTYLGTASNTNGLGHSGGWVFLTGPQLDF